MGMSPEEERGREAVLEFQTWMVGRMTVPFTQTRGQHAFSVMCHKANILGFVGLRCAQSILLL